MLMESLFYALSLFGVINYNMHVLLTSGNLLAHVNVFHLSNVTLLNSPLCRNYYVQHLCDNITHFKNIKHCLIDFF